MIANVLLVVRFALSAALYAFLGFAFYLLWRDLQLQARQVAARQAPRLSLRLPGPSGDEIRHFVHTPLILGRDPACECPVDDRTVSTRHARFSYHHNQWWLDDLDSTNGTLLNGHKVTQPVVLASGDQLTCGQVDVLVSITPQAPVQPAEPASTDLRLP